MNRVAAALIPFLLLPAAIAHRSSPDIADYVKPSPEERRWMEIPWRDSFRAGINASQIQGKPILLWAMNGHPMGCV